MQKVFTTILTVVIAVIASAGLWVLANLLFDQAGRNWPRFRFLCGAVIGIGIGILFAGNRATVGSAGSFLNLIWLPLLVGAALAFGAAVMANIPDSRTRVGVGIAWTGGVGVLIGILVRGSYQPALNWGALVLWTVALGAAGAGLAKVRGGDVVPAAAVGAALGAIIGGWGAADIGQGTPAEAIIATALPAALLGVKFGWRQKPNEVQRLNLERRARAVTFAGPAVGFIFIMLLIPAIRTFFLSFLNAKSTEYVGLENYRAIFRKSDTWNVENIGNFWGSRLLWIGAILLVIALVLGVIARSRTGKAVELGNPTFLPLLCGGVFVAFALFSVWRGTISNNLWWVVTVTMLSTTLGLAIAVLADNRKAEKMAKSLVFMPMAISMVGASVIWRFMYTSRDASQDQTGVMNALWVGLGHLSTGSGIPTYVVGLICIILCIGLLMLMAKALTRQEWSGAVAPGIGVLLLGWFTARYWQVWGGGVGGFTYVDGVPRAQAVQFIQEGPFNNMWLMVVLIWIQTGFAMIILSAAIKAVPTEYLEAARMDGATTSQIFWRITLPSIATTIGVVVTTLIVTVMKVYDIVKVMTNGNFGSQVLANDMAKTAFSDGNRGGGAALAILLFLSVLPVMVLNIRRMQREA